jgi:hypothetical protein
VLLDLVVLGEPDAEPQHHLGLILIDLAVGDLPLVESTEVGVGQLGAER